MDGDALRAILSEINLVPESTVRSILHGLVVDLPGAYDYIDAYLAEERKDVYLAEEES